MKAAVSLVTVLRGETKKNPTTKFIESSFSWSYRCDCEVTSFGTSFILNITRSSLYTRMQPLSFPPYNLSSFTPSVHVSMLIICMHAPPLYIPEWTLMTDMHAYIYVTFTHGPIGCINASPCLHYNHWLEILTSFLGSYGR